MTYQLSDIELAKAGQDLASWVLQDDMFDQDFCYMAEETPSHSVGFSGNASPFITMPCETSEMPFDIFEDMSSIKKENTLQNESPFPVFIEDEFDLQALMKEEIIQQQTLEQMNFIREQEEQELLLKQAQEQEKIEQDLIKQANEQQVTQFLNFDEVHYVVNDVDDFKEILLEDEPMEEKMIVSCDDDSVYYIDSPDDVELEHVNTPYIISVPVSEAYEPVTKCSFSVVSEDNSNEQCPEPFVINLKKVSIPNKCFSSNDNSSVAHTVQLPEPTLKDILCSDTADDVLGEFIKFPTPSDYSSTSTSPRNEDPSDSESIMSDCDSPQSSKGNNKFSPYSVGERKLRKKEQNKRAALRYRQKKKEEEDSVFSIMQKEEERQRILTEKRDSLKIELRLMKKLARDMIAARKKNSSA